MPALKRSIFEPGARAHFVALWLVVASCQDGSRHASRDVVVVVRDDGAEALAEVTIEVAGRVLGTTDALGRLRLALRPETTVSARCPEAYRPVAAQRVVAQGAQGVLTFVCRPRLRTIAVVVSAPAARGLTLRVDAQSLGRVDDKGLLHAVLRRAPGSKLSLSLAARDADREDAFATRTLEVEDRDRIVVFDAETGP